MEAVDTELRESRTWIRFARAPDVPIRMVGHERCGSHCSAYAAWATLFRSSVRESDVRIRKADEASVAARITAIGRTYVLEILLGDAHPGELRLEDGILDGLPVVRQVYLYVGKYFSALTVLWKQSRRQTE